MPPTNMEFEALAAATRYRRAIVSEFARVLSGDVVEIGAGIGQMTKELATLPAIRHLAGIEPDPDYCESLRGNVPQVECIQGTIASLGQRNVDSIVCINVLEHIADDRQELQAYHQRLAARQGHLCLFVPAGPELYAPMDKAFGHHRRYTKTEVAAKLAASGFEVLTLRYFNFIGYFLWFLEFKLLKQREFNAWKIRIFDTCVFPAIHWTETRLWSPPKGQSLLAIARAKP